MIKCYHARRVNLVIKTESSQIYYQGPVIAPLIATIKSDEEDLENIWDCCNNSCWWNKEDFRKMTNYKDIFKVEFTKDYLGYCNSDLIVETNNKFYVAKSIGWNCFSTFNEAVQYCANNAYWCKLINYKNKQYPTGKEHTLEELDKFKKEYEDKGFECFLIK